MRILIADDQDRVRRALRVLLTQQPGLRIVGEACSAAEFLVQARLIEADLALVDWGLPGLAEAGGLPGLRRSCPLLRFVVLSSRLGVRKAALAAGADAFVSMGDPPDLLLTVIRPCGVLAELGGTDATPE